MEHILSPEQLKEEFATRRKSQYILIAAAVVLIIFDVMLFSNNDAVFTLIFLVLIAVFTLFRDRIWRCPACEKFLGKNLNPSCCPKCGAQFK